MNCFSEQGVAPRGFSVGAEGELLMSCGGRTYPDYPYSQTTPLLPLHPPRPLPHLYRDELGLEQMAGMDAASQNFTTQIHAEKTISRNKLKKKPFLATPPEEVYGQENYFNGSCLQVINNLLFYTGNDGILLVRELSPEAARVGEQLSDKEELLTATEARLNYSRIYSVNGMESGETILMMTRYRNGFSYFKIPPVHEVDSNSVQPFTSIPCSEGSIGQCYLGPALSCMLDLNSNLTLLDLNSGKLKLRNKVSCGVEAFSWGVLSEGSGLNSVCVGARKSFGLVDIRAGSLEQVKTFEDKVYLRDMKTYNDTVYCTTDESVHIYDLRNLKERLSFPLEFEHSKIVQSVHMNRMDDKAWVFSASTKGDISLTVLDLSHENCDKEQPVDTNIKLQCARDKVPDRLGRGRLLQSWKDTVISARLNGGVWLEQAVQQRCEIQFRGVSVFHVPGSSSAQLFAVNAVGDLFASALSLEQDILDTRVEKEDEFDELLEGWGDLVYKNHGVKTMYVDKLYQRTRKRNGKKYNRGYMPVLETDPNEERGQLSISKNYKNKKTQETIPKLRKNDVCFDNKEDETGQKILKILGFKDVPEDEDTIPEDEVRPPEEEDPHFAIKSFLADLGVTGETQDTLDLSQYMGHTFTDDR